MQPLTTTDIKMAPKKMFHVLLMRYGLFWIIFALAGIVVFVVLGCLLNLKFLILALIWIFMILPILMAFLYFFYGLEPLTAFNCIPHKIFFRSGSLSVRLMDIEDQEIVEAEKEKKDYIAKREDFKEMMSGPGYVLLFFKKIGFLWVPVNAFDNLDSFHTAINTFVNEK